MPTPRVGLCGPATTISELESISESETLICPMAIDQWSALRAWKNEAPHMPTPSVGMSPIRYDLITDMPPPGCRRVGRRRLLWP